MARRTPRARTTTGAAVLALLLATAGCAHDEPGSENATPAPDARSIPAGGQALASYYAQQPTWKPCPTPASRTAVCTDLTVPLDYAHPQNGDTTVRLLKVPAPSGKASRGALFVNPGGPGGSATEYASQAEFIVTPKVLRAYDVVGLDPRGVGRSTPITCLDPKAVDAMIGQDPSPDTPAEADALRAEGKTLGDACLAKYPKLLGHVSTDDVAKDMDIARAALGQGKLDYLGKSYGTFLGATYAGLFPGRVGRMVLDGAIAPDLTNDQVNLGQAEGFERATRAYVADCVAQGDCPLGTDQAAALARLQKLLADIDAKPLPISNGSGVKQLTEGWATTGIAQAMYSQELWPGLTDALREAVKGDGTGLFNLAEQYAARNDDGTYSGNIMQVISAVNCLDRGSSPVDFATMQAREKQFEQKAPTWGSFMAWSSTTCESWPVKPVSAPKKIAAAGSGPIVVVGTTRDPATPYEWAQQLAAQLQNGHLITRDGDGHTGYTMGNTCVDKAVDAYLLDGKVPAQGTSC